MNRVSKKEMLDYIKKTVMEKSKTKEVTVYSIFKATDIKQTTIHNILKGKTENPREESLVLIYNFLVGKFGNKQDMYVEKKEKPLPENSDFDKLLEEKIKQVVNELTKHQFDEINKALVHLMRRSFDADTRTLQGDVDTSVKQAD